MPTNRLICLRYLRDSIRFSVGEDSSFRRAAFPKDYMYIVIRGQTSTNQEGKYACTRNLSPPLFPTHLVLSHCLYPFGAGNLVLLDSIDPLEPTRLPRLHCWIPSSPYTTQLRRVHRVPRSLIESVTYCTAPTAQLHSSDTTQRRRVRRVIFLYTTAKREVSSKGNGRRPGEGGRCDWRKQNGRKRGTFLGTFWYTLPEGRPTTGRPITGRPGWMGSTGWCRTRGSRTGEDMHPCPLVSLGLANPVRTGDGYNQMSAPSLPSPFGIGGRWGPQTTPRGAPPNRRSRWGPPMAPRSLANNSQGSLVNSSQGSESSSHRSGMGALQTKTSQVWVHATLWHATSSRRRLPIAVLVDTGAGGGNYVSRQFIESIEERDGWGKSLINPTGKGLLSAANPKNSAVPPMEVVGSCLLPLVFAPIDQIFRMKFRVVKGLPYAIS